MTPSSSATSAAGSTRLDRATGAERWKLNTRAEAFPGAHPINVFFASPILVDGKLIVGGGTLEQVIAAFPGYKASTGRGFVMALDPKSGKIIWKYDVGPKPERLDPPITIKDSWGDHVFHFGPATSSVWSTPSFDAESGTIFFGTDIEHRPASADLRRSAHDTRESCAVIALDVHNGAEKWVTQINSGDVWTNAMRSYDPKEGDTRTNRSATRPRFTRSRDGKPTKVVGVGCKNGGFYVLKAAEDDRRPHSHLTPDRPSIRCRPRRTGECLHCRVAWEGCKQGARQTADDLHQRNRHAPGSVRRRAHSIPASANGRAAWWR